jgi:hypothetical protein
MYLADLPTELYASLSAAQADPTTPRVYAIGARGYMVDLDALRAWYEARMAKRATGNKNAPRR